MDMTTNHKDESSERLHSQGLSATLDRAAMAIRDAVAENASLIARFDSLRERLQHSRLHLAVLGQFKRGKSTFINALLGAPFLPIAVVPLTAVPIFISWRAAPLVRVSFSDDRPAEECSNDDPDAIREFLFRFVAEEANPENRLGVDRVDLFCPATVLAAGTVLIDTPGVGSTFRHNTEAALRLLPECDAVLFVVSADPPITETELEYLRRFESKAAKLLFVLNKVDYLRPEERTRMAEFLRNVLEQNHLWPHDTRIFSVSARDGLAAKQRGNRKDLEESGIAEAEAYLTRHLAAEKNRLLDHAIRNKAREILAQAAVDVSLRIRALEMPLEDLASKVRAFEQALRSIEEQRRITRDLLEGEQRRVREELEKRINTLRGDASLKLNAVIKETVTAHSGTWGEAEQRTLSAEMGKVFDAARREFAGAFAGAVDTVLSAHQRRIDNLIEAVRQTAADVFNVPFRSGFEAESFALGEEPYWVTENIKATLIPDPSRLVDHFLTKGLRAKRVRARLVRQANDLILRNAENLRWAILRGIDETFRAASLTFDERLDDAIATTRGAVEETLVRRRSKSFAAGPDLERLNRANTLLASFHEELVGEENNRFVQSEPDPVHAG